jgi:spore germination cell wall hydrolase CwlJ-like protein
MAASRELPKGGLQAPFGLGVLMLLLLPSEVGYQDLAAFLSRQPPVVDRTLKGGLASPFGTIHEARLVMPRPVGAAVPTTFDYALAGLDPNSADITGAIRERILGESGVNAGPMVDRSSKGDYREDKDDRRVALKGDFGGGVGRSAALKGDRIAPVVHAEASTGPESIAQPEEKQHPVPQPTVEQGTLPHAALTVAAQPEHRPGAPLSLAPPSPAVTTDRHNNDGAGGTGGGSSTAHDTAQLAFASVDVEPALRAARLYFSVDPMGQKLGSIEPWAPGESPLLEGADEAPAAAQGHIKLAALPTRPPGGMPIIRDAPIERADLPPLPMTGGGQTVAPKGQVTGPDQRPMTPAERLGLDEKGRAKAEKCLTEAIYFEARGEVVRGQMAVAQVVLNRAFSGKYPDTVCGVVYQNAHRHLGCQFTFACDRIRDVVREPDMWERAKTIAAETLDGKLWLPEVGKATHYHAYWVRPWWVRHMTRLHKLGVHTFYRPRKWGDGEEAPEWGDPVTTAESAKRLVETANKL